MTGFLDRLRDLFTPSSVDVELSGSERVRLSGRGVRVAIDGEALELSLGTERLLLCPDPLLDGTSTEALEFLVLNPAHTGVRHQLRLLPGERLSISSDTPDHRLLFDEPREAFRRNVQIRHEGDSLVLLDPIAELGTWVHRADPAEGAERHVERRQQALHEVRRAYGGPIQMLSPPAALDTLKRVNALTRRGVFRRRDWAQNPGAVLELPDHITPILVGDLHAQVDNLLQILSSNGFVEAMDSGEAALILLGDAVHREEKEHLEEMDSSLLIMDLIFKLKLRFPERFFFLLGNHDGFSAEVMKRGVAQGLLYKRHVREVRGEAYLEELETFYQMCPLLAFSPLFVAAHAAPPRGLGLTREWLDDLRRDPVRVHHLTWDRVRSPGLPSGYGAGGVRQLRRALGVSKKSPFIVGHYPHSRDRTYWLDVGAIPDHHVVYSAMLDKIGVFVGLDGQMVPYVLRTEPLLAWVNSQPEAQARAGTG